ncbi:MAG TPA: iron-containing alcohol dehydrogenase [Planctomycetota bacterium]|nr:iron-containing alcohol dehydrogenase [Planctomycetota bacterium]
MKADPAVRPAPFEVPTRTRLVFGAGAVDRLGELARELGARRALVVTDPGIVAAGHLARARRALEAAGLEVAVYEGARENPTESDAEACAAFARQARPDLIVGLGGGSSMDTAKAANVLLANGRRMRDYWGYGKVRKPLLPLIAVPTTAGTGSEFQSYALISHDETHQKMACGDPKIAAAAALLDPELTLSQPRRVTANTGMDAVAHAVETAVTNKRHERSALCAREAFRRLVGAFRRVLEHPEDLEARAQMQLGAAYAGMAIELSMLGAAHALANPLTARFDVVHGQAVGMMLPHVVRFNAADPAARDIYGDLLAAAGLAPADADPADAGERLAALLEELLDAAGMPRRLDAFGVPASAVPELAAEAAHQWTARFNPRPVAAADLEALYRRALGTPAAATPPPPAPDDGESDVGNYFVSNYPPYSFWKPERAREALEAFEAPSAPGASLGVYVHIPFCRKRCHFCYFRVYTDKNAEEIQRYLDGLVRELSLLRDRPAVAGRRPDFVYFGGGTPSYLSVRQLSILADRMKELLPWDRAEEVTFECEPGTLTEEKLRYLREMGVTRLSLGVEHFDEDILRLNGRAHGAADIDRAYGLARQAGFPQINIDLIAGMMGDTDERWDRAVDRTLELRPDSVTIYQMEIPYNTSLYQDMIAKGLDVAPLADWRTKRRWTARAFERLEAAGYAVTSAYTAVLDPGRTRFVYRDRLWTGADLLGLGVASFGHIGGTHYQNVHHWEPYLEKLRAGELPVFRALRTTPEERFIREFILQMKLGRIRPDYFRAKFGTDVRERFAGPLAELRRRGYLEENGTELRLRREGLLRVDRLVHLFFLPEHRDARYT